jgi:hypothetical protein
MNVVPESLIDTVAEAIADAVERGDNLDHIALLAIRAAAPGIDEAPVTEEMVVAALRARDVARAKHRGTYGQWHAGITAALAHRAATS